LAPGHNRERAEWKPKVAVAQRGGKQTRNAEKVGGKET